MKPLHIAIAGLGTVGSGVATILQQSADAKKAFSLKHVLVRSIERTKSNTLFSSIEAQLTEDPQQILGDDVDVVMECIGGTTVAKELIEKALSHGKHVITANKDLMAIAGEELLALAQKHQVHLMFEASVAGALPIIHLLQNYFSQSDVVSVSGILNGTTNYILSKMDSEHVSFDAALSEAQALGFAEQDPTNDVKGYDARYKLTLLIYLCCRQWVPVEDIAIEGIDALTLADFDYAARMHCKIKLMAHFSKSGDQLSAFIFPLMIPETSVAAKISGATNMVTVNGDYAQDISLIGEGAGSLPTASAMIADLHKVLQTPVSETSTTSGNYQLQSLDEQTFKHTLRFEVQDQPGIVGAVGRILDEHHISIYAIEQLPQYHHGDAGCKIIFTITLEPCQEGVLQKALNAINQEAFMAKPVYVLRELVID